MRRSPALWQRSPIAKGRIVTMGSPEFGLSGIHRIRRRSISATWNSVNDPFAMQFDLPYGAVVDQLGWWNGSAAGGGVDCGIYDLSWNRLVSVGGATAVGNSLWEFVEVTDTPLAPGRYYLACSRDNVTANRITVSDITQDTLAMRLVGALSSTTDSYPLPDPLVGMGVNTLFDRIPLLAFTTKDF